jgi:membrane-bound ClpP family serine protease
MMAGGTCAAADGALRATLDPQPFNSVAMDVIPDIAWAILLLLIGLSLVVLEVFIPSGGIIGILSAVAMIAALVMAFQDSSTTGPMVGLCLRR